MRYTVTDTQARVRTGPPTFSATGAGLDPAGQVELAREIRESVGTVHRLLRWKGPYPTHEQLEFACKLIWQYFLRSGWNGVLSDRQLCFKIEALQRNPEMTARVKAELENPREEFRAKSADQAVERVFEFDRSWAGFDFPRYLSALSRIQAHVLSAAGYPTGDYSVYAALVEHLFQDPIIAALDEYGIPFPLALKLEPILRGAVDLDGALTILRALDLSSSTLTAF